MKELYYIMTVSDVEKRIIINALNQLRTRQLTLNKSTDALDELIIRTCDAPAKKKGLLNESR